MPGRAERRISAWGMALMWFMTFMGLQIVIGYIPRLAKAGLEILRRGSEIDGGSVLLILRQDYTGSGLGWLLIVGDLIIAATLILILKGSHKNIRKTVGARRFDPRLIVPLLFIGLGLALTLQSLAAAIAPLNPEAFNFNSNPVIQKYVTLYPTVSGAIAGVIIAPLVEEFTFRGLLFFELRTRLVLPAALIIQAALFGAAHGNIAQAISIFGVGCLFGWVFIRTRSVFCSMLVHASYNGAIIATYLLLWRSAFLHAWMIRHPVLWYLSASAVLLAAGSLLAIGLFWHISLTKRKSSATAPSMLVS
jgi:membrane protease YdiL (CAAX protease family)